MTPSMMMLAKIALAGAAGYAVARWFSAPARIRLPSSGIPAATASAATDTGSSVTPDPGWVPREGGHPGEGPSEQTSVEHPRG